MILVGELLQFSQSQSLIMGYHPWTLVDKQFVMIGINLDELE